MQIWKDIYPRDRMPGAAEIAAFVERAEWPALLAFLQEERGLKPKCEYSSCSMAPGWNVKFKSKGRAVCTLYPDAGKFACMVVIGEALQPYAELLLPQFDAYTQEIYRKTENGMGGKWLFLEVTSPEILRDTLELLALRMDGKLTSL